MRYRRDRNPIVVQFAAAVTLVAFGAVALVAVVTYRPSIRPDWYSTPELHRAVNPPSTLVLTRVNERKP